MLLGQNGDRIGCIAGGPTQSYVPFTELKTKEKIVSPVRAGKPWALERRTSRNVPVPILTGQLVQTPLCICVD